MGWSVPETSSSPFEPVSAFARAIASLFEGTLVVCAVIFAGVTAAIVYALVAYRARPDAPEPPQHTGHRGLEIGWTFGALAIVTVLFVLAIHTMRASDPAKNRSPDVVVVGHQWWWEARYPSGVVTANEIHVPAGRPLLVRLEAADVIHDFASAQLGRKMDAVPGHPNEFWLGAEEPGTYSAACHEYCGLQHAWMRALLFADPPADFDAWQRAQLVPAAPPAGEAAVRGEAIFRSSACGTCHAVAGRGFTGGIAPDLTHLASRRALGAGVVDLTPRNLEAWLRDPAAIKPGVHMPAYDLPASQLDDLLAYLEGLR